MFFIAKTNGPALLLALGLGYIVCALAGKEAKFLKKLGYAIGAFIILVSGILLLAKVLWTLSLNVKTCGVSGGHRMLREQTPPEMPMPKAPQK